MSFCTKLFIDGNFVDSVEGATFEAVNQSGYGRDLGFEAMREYTEAKSIWVNVDAQLPHWYADREH